MSDVPFLPYARQSIDEDDVQAVVEVLRSSFLTTGPAVTEFERDLAHAVGAEWAVAVSSGTAALHAACFAAGLRPGDEAIVPAITFVATANCVRYVGAEPKFADVDPDTGLVSADAIADGISPATRAIFVVHLGGACADVLAASEIAERAGATVVEDAAHALGAMYGESPVGSCRDGSSLAIFSFHPVKHITTGEGGAVTGRTDVLERAARLARDHGIERDPARFTERSPGPWYYEQQALGHNLRLTDIQAALGSSQLRKLSVFLARRRALAAAYADRLRDFDGVKPVVDVKSAAACAYHLYQVSIDFAGLKRTREAVMRGLREQGIGSQVHYIPVPMQPYYRERGWDPDAFPGAMRFYERTLSLPLFPAMTDGDVDRVVTSLRRVLHGSR